MVVDLYSKNKGFLLTDTLLAIIILSTIVMLTLISSQYRNQQNNRYLSNTKQNEAYIIASNRIIIWPEISEEPEAY